VWFFQLETARAKLVARRGRKATGLQDSTVVLAAFEGDGRVAECDIVKVTKGTPRLFLFPVLSNIRRFITDFASQERLPFGRNLKRRQGGK